MRKLTVHTWGFNAYPAHAESVFMRILRPFASKAGKEA